MIVVFLDLDGTIADLQKHPTDVHLDKAFIAAINKLTEQHKVIITSGRDISSLREIFAATKVEYIACHGAEIFCSGEYHNFLSQSELAGINTLKAAISQLPWHENLIENKSHSIAIHAVNGDVDFVRVSVEPLIKGQSEIGILMGKNVVEIKPKSINKGIAIKYVLENKIDKYEAAIFIGDDTTDIPALEYISSMGGITGFVGNKNIPANMHFSTPAQCRLWLSDLAEQKIQLSAI